MSMVKYGAYEGALDLSVGLEWKLYPHLPVVMFSRAWVFEGSLWNRFEITPPSLFLANQSLGYYRYEGSE